MPDVSSARNEAFAVNGDSVPGGGKEVSGDNAGNLTREDARINAEIRCYAEFQAPDSYTKLPRCTDLPRYLELRFGHMRIISSIYVRLGMSRYAIQLMALLNSPALSPATL
jgi:hypothetical protein